MNKLTLIAIAIALAALAAWFVPGWLSAQQGSKQADAARPEGVPESAARALVAGGCFWCVEKDFEKLDSVYAAVSGYAGGELENPTYRNHEGHVEAVEIFYDPEKITYRALIDYFFRHIDPTDAGGQFCDRGFAYTTAIFVETPEERAAAEAALAEAQTALGKPIVTPVRDRTTFTVAEDYHQDYYKKNPLRYATYRTGCGRDRRINALWGKAE